MTKEEFHKTWYFRWLRVLYWSSLDFVCVTLTILSFLEGDVEIAGAVWSVGIAGVYWLMKRVTYRLMFGERIWPRGGKPKEQRYIKSEKQRSVIPLVSNTINKMTNPLRPDESGLW